MSVSYLLFGKINQNGEMMKSFLNAALLVILFGILFLSKYKLFRSLATMDLSENSEEDKGRGELLITQMTWSYSKYMLIEYMKELAPLIKDMNDKEKRQFSNELII